MEGRLLTPPFFTLGGREGQTRWHLNGPRPFGPLAWPVGVLTVLVEGPCHGGWAVVDAISLQICILEHTHLHPSHTKVGVATSNINIYNEKSPF